MTAKLITSIFLTSLMMVSSSSFAEASERLKATGESVQGNVQETVGEVTNNPDLKAKGKANKTKAKLRNTKEDVKELLTDD